MAMQAANTDNVGDDLLRLLRTAIGTKRHLVWRVAIGADRT